MIWWCMSEGRYDIITFIFCCQNECSVQVKLLYNILSETKYTMHLFQLCPLCACRLLPTRCWKTAIRLNNTCQQLCHMYILYIYYLHMICIFLIYMIVHVYMSMNVCCQIKFDLI